MGLGAGLFLAGVVLRSAVRGGRRLAVTPGQRLGRPLLAGFLLPLQKEIKRQKHDHRQRQESKKGQKNKGNVGVHFTES